MQHQNTAIFRMCVPGTSVFVLPPYTVAVLLTGRLQLIPATRLIDDRHHRQHHRHSKYSGDDYALNGAVCSGSLNVASQHSNSMSADPHNTNSKPPH